MFVTSQAFSPEYLADIIPGAPFSAYTSSPESSATAGLFVHSAIDIAFFTALPSKVSLSSSTSGQDGKSSIVRMTTSIPSRILAISSTFFLFLVAKTISIKPPKIAYETEKLKS